MNNFFYSANGSMNNYKIIEHFDSPNEGVSIISHLIESEKQKNKIVELENKINELETKLGDLDLKTSDKVNEVKKYLPFNNDDFSSINTNKLRDWNLEDNNIFIDVIFCNSGGKMGKTCNSSISVSVLGIGILYFINKVRGLYLMNFTYKKIKTSRYHFLK